MVVNSCNLSLISQLSTTVLTLISRVLSAKFLSEGRRLLVTTFGSELIKYGMLNQISQKISSASSLLYILSNYAVNDVREREFLPLKHKTDHQSRRDWL